MITNDRKYVAEISECSEIMKMGIDHDSDEDMEQILEILSDSMYSNKPLTLLREYSTNAYDAHVEAGIGDRPIEVFLPTPLRPELRIRDYGFGLSREGMDVFRYYAKSTKRNSNSVVGHLGVGSKSAFSYTDTFTITSIHEGIKSVYSATKDATGCNIYCLNSEPTEEPSGVEISVFINRNDMAFFLSNAISCFKHFNPRPIILNNTDVDYHIDSYHKTKLLDAGDWAVYDKESVSPVSLVMGNVLYPVDINNLEIGHENRQFLNYWSRKSVVLFANIGDVSHASTRESLKYDAKTKQWLIDKIGKMPSETASMAQKFISDCATLWDALVLYNTLEQSKLGNALKSVTYDNKVLSTIYSSISKYHPSTCQKWNPHVEKWESTDFVRFAEKTIVFYAKGDITANSKYIRYSNYIRANGIDVNQHKVYLIFFKNPENAQKFLESDAYKDCYKVDLADCPYNKTRKERNKLIVPVGSILQFDYAYSNRTNSSHWKVAQNIPDNETKYYITISHYQPVEFPSSSMHDLNVMLSDLRLVTTWDAILYGVKKSDVAKLDDTWVNITTLFKEKMLELCHNQQMMNFHTHISLRNDVKSYEILLNFLPYLDSIDDSHPIKQFLGTITFDFHESHRYFRIKRYYNAHYLKNSELYEEHKAYTNAFLDRYFLLRHIEVDRFTLNDILEYTKSG